MTDDMELRFPGNLLAGAKRLTDEDEHFYLAVGEGMMNFSGIEAAVYAAQYAPLVGSPLEGKYLGSLLVWWRWIFKALPTVCRYEEFDAGADGAFIIPQFPVRAAGKQYRADFMYCASAYRLAIECDGHNFHASTKEQAANDRGRDRSFTIEGIPFIRFTGSEINRDPIKCARQTMEAIATVRQK